MKESKLNYEIINKAEQVYEILNEFLYCFPVLEKSLDYRMEMAKKLSDNAFFVLLQIDNENAGFASIYANDYKTQIAYISFFAIAENYRKMHLGTRLMNEIVKIAKEKGMRLIKLEVLKSNTVAQMFYKKNGFYCQEITNDEMIKMVKEI